MNTKTPLQDGAPRRVSSATSLLMAACCLVWLHSTATARIPQITVVRPTPTPSNAQSQPAATPDKSKPPARSRPDPIATPREQKDPSPTLRLSAPILRPTFDLTPLPKATPIVTPRVAPVQKIATPAPTLASRIEASPTPQAVEAAQPSPALKDSPSLQQAPDTPRPYLLVLLATLAVFTTLVLVLLRLRRKLREDRSA